VVVVVVLEFAFCIWGLMLGRQVLYYLSHTLNLFFALVIFGEGVMVLPSSSLDYRPLTYVSCVAGSTGMHHHASLVC
jgi:hypothetical protein